MVCLLCWVTVSIVIVLLVVVKSKKSKKPASTDVEMLKSGSLSSVATVMQLPVISNIEIKKKLGEGNFGEIYLGVWNGTKLVEI